MNLRKPVITLLLASNLLLFACVYIVLPEGLDTSGPSESKGWSAVATNVSETAAGDLHIDLTIRNETGDWSSMKAVDGKAAVLKTGNSSTDCETVMVGTGGHRLAPGFQMRGYLGGTKAKPVTQLLYVECKGAKAAPGAELSADYIYFNGPLDYYHQEEGKGTGTFTVKLDELAQDLSYPVYEPVEGLIQPADIVINAISDNKVSLLAVRRTDAGLEFQWQNSNPTEFALKTHIGNPPVIGADGIIYGLFEIMDLASVPVTPAGGAAEWTTTAAVPQDDGGFYILLSVESKQMRLYVNYALDITDK